MERGDGRPAWVAIGAFGGLALGILLIPLRTVTSASNLAFAFVAFTIAVAEMGGRFAAVVAAVVSTLALNFFLTEPYLTLAISKPDDVVAFLALAACGLIAAAFGRRRERMSELAARAGGELELLDRLVGRLRADGRLDDALGELRRHFGLQAVVLRDSADRVLGAAAAGQAPAALPGIEVTPDTLLPADESRLRFGARGLRLPEGGGRLRIASEGGPVALDLWEGDPRGFGVNESRALTIAASILALELSQRQARHRGAR